MRLCSCPKSQSDRLNGTPPSAKRIGTADSKIFNPLLKFACKMSSLRFGRKVRAALPLCGPCDAHTGSFRLRVAYDGEIQNVQAALIDGLLEL